MKKNYPIYMVLLVAALLSFSCKQAAQEDPNADAVYKSITETYTLHPDGAVTTTYQHELKLQSFFSFNRLYGEDFIVYNPDFQSVEVLTSETKMADGKIVASPENAYNEVLPRFAAGAPAYNQLRELVVTHTALEPEATIYFHYQVESKAGYLPFLMEKIQLQKASPVNEYTIEVKVPIEKELTYNLSHMDVIPRVSTKGDIRIYKWHFHNIPASSGEAHQPHSYEHRPQLSFSSAKTDEAAKWIKTQKPGFADAIASHCQKRLTGITSPYEKVETLHQIFANEINTFEIPMAHTGYKTRTAEAIWKDNGATPIEKAWLLAAAINNAGIEANALVSIATVGTEPVGNLNNLAHPYVQVQLEGQTFFLLPDAKQTIAKETVMQNSLINLNTGELLTPKTAVANKKLSMKATAAIDGKLQVAGTVKLRYEGLAVNQWQLFADSKYAEKRMAPFGNEKTITKVEADKNKYLIEGEAKLDKLASITEMGDVYALKLPAFPKGLKGMHLNALSTERNTPLALPSSINETYKLEITLSSEMQWMALPKTIELTNNIGQVKIAFNQTGEKLQIIKELAISEQLISPANYSAFKTLTDAWVHPQYQEVLFQKK